MKFEGKVITTVEEVSLWELTPKDVVALLKASGCPVPDNFEVVVDGIPYQQPTDDFVIRVRGKATKGDVKPFFEKPLMAGLMSNAELDAHYEAKAKEQGIDWTEEQRQLQRSHDNIARLEAEQASGTNNPPRCEALEFGGQSHPSGSPYR